MKDIVLVGSGGFAREVKWLIEDINRKKREWNVLGWISNEPEGTIIDGLPVLGGDSWMLEYKHPINAVVCIGNGLLRKKIVYCYSKNVNISYPNLIAPDATIGATVRLGNGCIIAAKCVFTVNIEIGDFFIGNLASTIGHDCVINDYVTIFPGAHISGGVMLEKNVSIGTGANIIQGIRIGENSFIGAGATVINNIPANCTAVGVPARPLEK